MLFLIIFSIDISFAVSVVLLLLVIIIILIIIIILVYFRLCFMCIYSMTLNHRSIFKISFDLEVKKQNTKFHKVYVSLPLCSLHIHTYIHMLIVIVIIYNNIIIIVYSVYELLTNCFGLGSGRSWWRWLRMWDLFLYRLWISSLLYICIYILCICI